MKAKVIKSTDWSFVGNIYEVSSLDGNSLTEATHWKFSFDLIELKWNKLRLKNSNFTAILKVIG